MLDESKFDDSLVKMIEKAESAVLNAKTKEEAEAAKKWYGELQREATSRRKVDNDHLDNEGKILIEGERFDYDKVYQEKKDELEYKRLELERQYQMEKDRLDRRHSRVELGINVAFKLFTSALLVFGLKNQRDMAKNDIIETDSISKGVTRSLMDRFKDFWKL